MVSIVRKGTVGRRWGGQLSLWADQREPVDGQSEKGYLLTKPATTEFISKFRNISLCCVRVLILSQWAGSNSPSFLSTQIKLSASLLLLHPVSNCM